MKTKKIATEPINTKRKVKPKDLKDIKSTFYETEAGYKNYSRMISWVKNNVIKPRFNWENPDEAEKALSFVNGEYQSIQFITSDNMALKDKEYYSLLLQVCCKERKLTLKEFAGKAYPSQLRKINLHDNTSGWTCINYPNKRHRVTTKLKGDKYAKYQRVMMWDFQTLLAETYLDNRLYLFAKSMEKQIQEKVVTLSYAFQKEKHVYHLPQNKEFQKTFKEALFRCYDGEKKPFYVNPKIDAYRSLFELKNVSDGYILNWIMESFIETLPHAKMERFNIKETRKSVHETNKNIRDTLRHLMEDNRFLIYYKDVELHNDLKEETFLLLEKDFRLLETYITIPMCDNVSFRIKRIGHHHAEGLFISNRDGMHLIVDVENVDAYVHELGHQIDKVKGGKEKLSLQEGFKHLLKDYRKLTESAVSELGDTGEEKKVKERWNSNKAFNKNYYLQHAEIFARCFEIFIDEIAPPTMLSNKNLPSYYYPTDVNFRKEVVHYFRSIGI